MEGELVPRIGGGANGTKGCKKYVERREMIQGESWASLAGMAEKAVHSLRPHFWSQLYVCLHEAASEDRWET